MVVELTVLAREASADSAHAGCSEGSRVECDKMKVITVTSESAESKGQGATVHLDPEIPPNGSHAWCDCGSGHRRLRAVSSTFASARSQSRSSAVRVCAQSRKTIKVLISHSHHHLHISSKGDNHITMAENAPMEVDAPATKQPRFQVKKWNAVCLWSWDIVVDNVGIASSHSEQFDKAGLGSSRFADSIRSQCTDPTVRCFA